MKIWKKLSALFQRRKREAEMAEEMRHHVDLQTERNRVSGMDEDEARYAALRQFGNLPGIQEEARAARGFLWLDQVMQDVRYAGRQFVRAKGFSVTVVLTLTLGIGSCTAIFSIVNGLWLKSLPYDQPGQLVQLWEDPSGKGQKTNAVAGAQFSDWREQASTMENLSVIVRNNVNLTGDRRPERLLIHRVSANYLQILRLQPFLGRGFLPEEEQPGKDKVVILTHRLWQRSFGGSSDVVGRTIQLSDKSYTVIGVLPATPELPFECSAIAPFAFGDESWHFSRDDHRLRVIGRLRSGATLAQAQMELDGIAQRGRSLYPAWKNQWGVIIVPLQQQLFGALHPQLWLLSGAVGFVLLIACANVAGLLLARMAGREKEIALRAALGAGRSRVFRQLLTESALLALIGGALGLALAYWGVALFAQLSEGILPQIANIGLDSSALGFALLLSLVTGVAFGLVPARRLARRDLTAALQHGGRGSSTGSEQRTRGFLIIAEIALALMLLVGAGLMLQTLVSLQSVPSGFNPQNALAIDLALGDTKHPVGDRRAAYLREMGRQIEALPGVDFAGAVTTLPMSGFSDSSVRAESDPDRAEFNLSTGYDLISGHYYAAMGIPLLQGRTFTEADDSTRAQRVAIVSKTLANKIFPGENPLGKRVRFWGELWEVVGVAGNVRQHGLDSEIKAHLYLPQAFSAFSSSLVVRTQLSPMTMVRPIQRAILELDPDQPVFNIRTLGKIVEKSTGQRRMMFVLLGVFAGVALLLSAIGLYGVVAYSVGQRTREIGIRMALGAQRGEVVGQILRQGLRLAVCGVALGIAGSFALSQLLEHLLFAVTSRDPLTFVGVSLLLLIVALLACWLPARRAAKVDPVITLRAE